MAFILQNSIEASTKQGAVTNIKNTINIYNTHNTNVVQAPPYTASAKDLKTYNDSQKISILQTGQTLQGSISQRVTTTKKPAVKSGGSTGKSGGLKSTLKKSSSSKKTTTVKKSDYQSSTAPPSYDLIPSPKGPSTS